MTKLLVSSLACSVIVLIHNYSVEGGELFDRVVSVTRFEEPTAKLLFYQMLVAVKVGKLLVASLFCRLISRGKTKINHSNNKEPGQSIEPIKT